MSIAGLVKRLVIGRPLTAAEHDTNLTLIEGAVDLKAPIASPTFTGTVSGVTKSMVGLGNVDNTSDANKPVSTAQATADTAVATAAATDATTKANAAQAHAIQRGNHTGEQAISTVTGLQAALDGKSATGHGHAIEDVSGLQTALDGKLASNDASVTNAREWTAETISQEEAEAGVSTTRRAWTAVRAFQAIAAWWAASAAKTKLDGIATGATANASDSQLRDRTTHTGEQAISTVTGLQAALDGKTATGHDHAASDITSGTMATARLGSGTANSSTFLRGDQSYAGVSQLGTEATISGSGSKAITLDSTPRTVSQANTLAIMGGKVGVGTLAPDSTVEIVDAAATLGRLVRIRNTSATTPTTSLDMGIGTPGNNDNECWIGSNGVRFVRIAQSQNRWISERNLGFDNNVQIVGNSNTNAHITMNNGASTMLISCVAAIEFQQAYVAMGRWDSNRNFHVGSNNLVSSFTDAGGVIVAGAYARSRLHGQMSTSGGRFANTGDAQGARYHLRNTTTDAATATELFLNGSAMRLTIPANSCHSFTVRLAAYNSSDGLGAAWNIRGAIRRNNSNGTVIVGTNVTDVLTEGAMSGCVVAVTADDTNEALAITVNGLATKTIRWHAVVETSEVSSGTAS
jgi:hypothetical protein